MAIGMTISREAGVGVETIGFYERRGLIEQPPRPRGGGYRYYDSDVIGRAFMLWAERIAAAMVFAAALYFLYQATLYAFPIANRPRSRPVFRAFR